MDLLFISNYIKNYSPTIIGVDENSLEITELKMISTDKSTFNPYTLYFGDTSQLPAPEQGVNLSFLVYGKELDWTAYSDQNIRILYISSKDDCNEAFNIIYDKIHEMQKTNAGLHMLINAFLTDQGLQYLTDVGYQVFGNPLFIVDNRYKYLAISNGIITDSSFASEENRIGYINQKGLDYLKKNKIDEKIRHTHKPVYFVNPLHNKGMLVDSITINGIEVGHVMLYEQDKPFDEFDNVLLHRTSRIISMELQKNSFLNVNKGLMYSYFLADLLDNPDANSSLVEDRLESFGYKLFEDQYIIVIPAHQYESSQTKLDIITEELRYIFKNSMFAIYHHNIVMLLSRKSGNGISESELDRLDHFLQTNNLKAGLSNFYNSLQDSRRFYKQAAKAVDLGLKFGEPESIYVYSKYYLYHIFEMCEKEDTEIRFFIHPGMMRLMYYDQNHGTHFLDTLHEFLESPGQSAQIAKRLNIHKNTLLYRMEKIRQIMDCKIESGDEFMSYGLSYALMKYLMLI